MFYPAGADEERLDRGYEFLRWAEPCPRIRRGDSAADTVPIQDGPRTFNGCSGFEAHRAQADEGREVDSLSVWSWVGFIWLGVLVVTCLYAVRWGSVRVRRSVLKVVVIYLVLTAVLALLGYQWYLGQQEPLVETSGHPTAQ